MSFKIGGTEILVSFTLLCLFACCVISGAAKSFLWCAAAVAVHESGHLIMMKKCGCFPKRIKISLFEISIADEKREQRGLWKNAAIIFFGPFANFICFPVSYLLYLCGIEFLLPFAAANLSVGLFNFLPVMSLDGGQLLYLLLSRRFGHRGAERAVDIATFICIFPLAAMGFLVLLRSKNNFSLLFVCVYLIISLIFRGNRYY